MGRALDFPRQMRCRSRPTCSGFANPMQRGGWPMRSAFPRWAMNGLAEIDALKDAGSQEIYCRIHIGDQQEASGR
jgi:hypothetical protein